MNFLMKNETHVQSKKKNNNILEGPVANSLFLFGWTMDPKNPDLM